MKKDLYSVENDLFQHMLKMANAFLCEVIARHGTGKIDGAIKVENKVLPYHMD